MEPRRRARPLSVVGIADCKVQRGKVVAMLRGGGQTKINFKELPEGLQTLVNQQKCNKSILDATSNPVHELQVLCSECQKILASSELNKVQVMVHGHWMRFPIPAERKIADQLQTLIETPEGHFLKLRFKNHPTATLADLIQRLKSGSNRHWSTEDVWVNWKFFQPWLVLFDQLMRSMDLPEEGKDRREDEEEEKEIPDPPEPDQRAAEFFTVRPENVELLFPTRLPGLDFFHFEIESNESGVPTRINWKQVPAGYILPNDGAFFDSMQIPESIVQQVIQANSENPNYLRLWDGFLNLTAASGPLAMQSFLAECDIKIIEHKLLSSFFQKLVDKTYPQPEEVAPEILRETYEKTKRVARARGKQAVLANLVFFDPNLF